MNSLNSSGHTMCKLICYITWKLQRHAHTSSGLAETRNTNMFVCLGLQLLLFQYFELEIHICSMVWHLMSWSIESFSQFHFKPQRNCWCMIFCKVAICIKPILYFKPYALEQRHNGEWFGILWYSILTLDYVCYHYIVAIFKEMRYSLLVWMGFHYILMDAYILYY